jgi:hypothetical protein
MREKRRKKLREGGTTGPHIQLEGPAGAIADGDLGDGAKGPEAGDNVHPNGGVSPALVSASLCGISITKRNLHQHI